MEQVPAPLAAWESFYVIVGSTAGALTGLMFVVIALIAEVRTVTSTRELDAFGTPTIVHFCTALLLAAILSAPWQSLTSVAIVLGALGLGGVAYCGIVLRRARQQAGYKPVLEDWIWHTVLPTVAYLAVFIAALAFTRNLHGAFFALAGSALLLLFIGIHNAWDTVTWLVANRDRSGKNHSRTA